MLKKTLLLLFCSSLLASESHKNTSKLSTTTRTIVVAGTILVVVGAGIYFAPVILPASTVAAIKASVAGATVKVTAAATSVKASTAVSATIAGITAVDRTLTVAKPVAENIDTAIRVGYIAQEELFPSNEQKNRKLRLEEEIQLRKAKKEFADCLAKNRTCNSLTIPKPCEALAGMIALSSSYEEVAKILQN